MSFLRRSGEGARRVLSLPVATIRTDPDRPRRDFDSAALAELSESIRAFGVLQPLIVRRTPAGWELVSGERRLLAAELAGLSRVPCLPVKADGQTAALLALAENLQRQDPDFWEEALALDRLIRTYCLSQEDVARRVGKSRSAVANKLRLLRLPPEVLASLRRYGLSEGHAQALLRLERDPRLARAARSVIRRKLTAAQTERYVDSLLAGDAPPRAARRLDPARPAVP